MYNMYIYIQLNLIIGVRVYDGKCAYVYKYLIIGANEGKCDIYIYIYI